MTRQPSEGRSRDGGLRYGEMERDCMLAYGTGKFMNERMYTSSDRYQINSCSACGLMVVFNNDQHIHECKYCGNRSDFSLINMPYACKLLFQELMSMNVAPRIITDKFIQNH